MSRVLYTTVLLAVLPGCHALPGRRTMAASPTTTPVRIASTNAPRTCAEWVNEARRKPELDVERVPEPVAYNPAPIPRNLPPGAVGPDGRAEVRIKVVVDTLGRADMKTFKVVRSTHPALTSHVRNAVAQWKFRPAKVGGCKVPRMFNWAAVTNGTAKSNAAKSNAAKSKK